MTKPKAAPKPYWQNETQYPTREVGKIVQWVMRYLEVERKACYVKVKGHAGAHAYQGRFFPTPGGTA